jgi:hypothetical protein
MTDQLKKRQTQSTDFFMILIFEIASKILYKIFRSAILSQNNFTLETPNTKIERRFAVSKELKLTSDKIN